MDENRGRLHDLSYLPVLYSCYCPGVNFTGLCVQFDASDNILQHQGVARTSYELLLHLDDQLR